MECGKTDKMIDDLVIKAKSALEIYMKMNQSDIDKIVESMAIAAVQNHVIFSEKAVDETLRGIVEDKIIKNMFASEYIYNSIKNKKTVGIIDKNDEENYIKIAEPLGVIAGITPVTNPTSTVIFKSLICAKTRNPIIFGFHPGAQQCCKFVAEILKNAAIEAGAPENCIQWIEHPSIEATAALMNHSGVDVVLATGGSGMVKSAYSTGKPALGVGPGNVPCYIEKSAKLERACNDLILSKTFDNGMICASEQSVVVEEDIASDFESIMVKNGCVFLNEEEISKLTSYMINPQKGTLNGVVAGKSAFEIAKSAGINVPESTKILIAKLQGVGKEYPLSVEKLSPVLSYYTVENFSEGLKICEEILKFNGEGHTAVIHSQNEQIIEKFSETMDAGRIIVNSPSSQGAIGDIYNCACPSLTLGCGSKGKNSTTDNVSVNNLLNIKRVYKRRVNMQWFKVPPKIYFEKGSISYLEDMSDVNRVVVVTDKTMVNLGHVEKVKYHLSKKNEKCSIEVFSDVSPDPDVETVWNGLEVIKRFSPDAIIALGGGSPIDAAKAMWMFYEYPELDFKELKLKFMDIRKRVFKYPVSHKIPLIAVPTTSGTGSEVTSFAVITDKKEKIKYPLADYFLTPDIAVIDPDFVVSLPKSPTADTGMDVLTHAIEAYVSTMASDYTDALAEKAIKLVFKYLKKAYDNGSENPEAREKMHNASCIAGMAFTNAFLGLNHSMAHKLGGEFHISHGRANAILLPYVIRYNASLPSKFAAFPKYGSYRADEKYSEIASMIGVSGETVAQSIDNLIESIKKMNISLGIPLSLKEYGLSESEFLQKVDMLSKLAHQDQCTGTNPRYPLINEIKEIYLNCYYGK